ncbi:MAG: hypothetical protein IPM42_21100 [Saprospiraceae bacterium]|nr:hypothetical protein [Saprospiraceae bacterium]
MKTETSSTAFYNDWKIMLLAALTIGLAPFVPEPHIIGKLKWIAGGGIGMKTMDYLDTAMHGIPWLLLFRIILLNGLEKWRSSKTKTITNQNKIN